MWPWPWPDDLHIRTGPVCPEDLPYERKWTSYIKVFESHRLTDRQTSRQTERHDQNYYQSRFAGGNETNNTSDINLWVCELYTWNCCRIGVALHVLRDILPWLLHCAYPVELCVNDVPRWSSWFTWVTVCSWLLFVRFLMYFLSLSLCLMSPWIYFTVIQVCSGRPEHSSVLMVMQVIMEVYIQLFITSSFLRALRSPSIKFVKSKRHSYEKSPSLQTNKEWTMSMSLSCYRFSRFVRLISLDDLLCSFTVCRYSSLNNSNIEFVVVRLTCVCLLR